ESVVSIIRRMKESGYTVDHVPKDSKELIDECLSNVTNDFNWMNDSEILDKCIDTVGREQYGGWFGGIPEFNRKKMIEHWGEAPGTVTTVGDRMIIPGVMNGNILISYQPLRAWSEKSDSLYHDPVLSPPHQYLAYYRWLKEVWGADAVVHMGTHGSLEWLPGKTVGLSAKCYPDLILNSIPDIYPYMIDDPGEGIQAKRRAEAVLIGHLHATMARADGYEDLEKLNDLIQEYIRMGPASNERKDMILKDIYDEAVKLNILGDIFDEQQTPESLRENIWNLHDYLTEIKDALIRDGLHILGHVPSGERFIESLYSLTRLRNGEIPSLRESLLSYMGYDPDAVRDDPSGTSKGKLNSDILSESDDRVMGILRALDSEGYDTEKGLQSVKDIIGGMSDDIERTVRYICTTLVKNLRGTSGELDNLMHALDGGYVLPGPSGAPTRGNADILPTGRNYYGIDPDTIPTRSSWEIGKKMADQMIERYVNDKGEYPKEIGFIIWATDTYKNDGDDVAYILWLMGVRPVWSKNGPQVCGLEVVPLKELGRPRLDVTVRITGLFRDTFPNLIDLIDDAVKLVSGLDEADKDNQLAANLRKDIIEGIAEGLTEDEARKRSSVRIFGCPPGAYGPGINHAVESSDWKTVQDLADIYITWGSSAYGRGHSGESMKDEFVKRFSKVGVTVKNMPDREIDLFDIDDVYGYLGGLNAFVRTYGRKDAVSYMGDGSNPENTKVRSASEESKFVFRSKILNPKYIDGMMQHGYRGAAEMANLTEYVFGWDATSDIIEKWMYDGIAEKYLLDEKVKEWMLDVNPPAMKDILDRLYEAIDRGMWDADDDMKQKLKDLYFEMEDRIEEVTDR
ncbi:MAG: cobaltochelatase subunit CobN, partial [Candidatus Methanomethylophilaceae archaeon]|nr:cobaltochelatase subunit CobN [Candidatus Methanomethylophilaceae archaeon]